jgi:glycosyltransferase involved in cell wall biosynthesis
MPVKGGLLGRTYAKFIMNRACKNSDVVLTVSKFSKTDIVDLFPKCSRKVKVVYNGIDKSIFKPLPEKEIESFRERYSLGREFLLYVGALKNHKNPAALVKAINEFAIPLVVLTDDGTEFENKLLSRVNDKKLLKMIQLTNELEIALLYNSGTALFHPSLYEGFGLPPLEAMACGLPVVCSNKTSLPEVVGDAAVTFSPDNQSEMLSALKSVWESREIRIKLSARGLTRSDKFGWENTAGKTFEILRDVASR